MKVIGPSEQPLTVLKSYLNSPGYAMHNHAGWHHRRAQSLNSQSYPAKRHCVEHSACVASGDNADREGKRGDVIPRRRGRGTASVEARDDA
jgi:hypothetical protein